MTTTEMITVITDKIKDNNIKMLYILTEDKYDSEAYNKLLKENDILNDAVRSLKLL